MTTILTPIIALIALYIAFMQAWTAKEKLKLDLFEKRLKVYDVARNFIESIVESGETKEEEKKKFISDTNGSKWLFNDDIRTYFEEQLWKNAIDLEVIKAELEGSLDGNERSNKAQRQGEIIKWFNAQFNVLDEKFSPFLRFESMQVAIRGCFARCK